MSQRTEIINEEIVIELKLKVTIDSFSNHNGFKANQIQDAIDEFKDKIQKITEYGLFGQYEQQEILETVDFVKYTISHTN